MGSGYEITLSVLVDPGRALPVSGLVSSRDRFVTPATRERFGWLIADGSGFDRVAEGNLDD